MAREAGVDELDDQEERLVAEGEIAGDYSEELLDLLDFDGDIDLDVEGNRAVVSIDGSDDLKKLVGRGGEVLDALQELTRLAVHQKTGVRSRLMLDIAELATPPPRGTGGAGRQGGTAGAGDRRARRAVPDDAVRAQDRPRRRRGGARGAQRKRGRGARAASCRPARLASYRRVVPAPRPIAGQAEREDVSRETCRPRRTHGGPAPPRPSPVSRRTPRPRSSVRGSTSRAGTRSCWPALEWNGVFWAHGKWTASGIGICSTALPWPSSSSRGSGSSISAAARGCPASRWRSRAPTSTWCCSNRCCAEANFSARSSSELGLAVEVVRGRAEELWVRRPVRRKGMRRCHERLRRWTS